MSVEIAPLGLSVLRQDEWVSQVAPGNEIQVGVKRQPQPIA